MIKTWEEYNEIEQICDEADDRIKSGAWASGIHFELMNILGKHGIHANGREGAVRETRKLLTEFYKSVQAKSDEEKYGDDDWQSSATVVRQGE